MKKENNNQNKVGVLTDNMISYLEIQEKNDKKKIKKIRLLPYLKKVYDFIAKNETSVEADLFCDGFVEGSEWRINSIWHERTEPAEEGNDIILLFPDGKCTVMTLNGEWELIIAWLMFYKWAYLKDILPDNFVKTK